MKSEFAFESGPEYTEFADRAEKAMGTRGRILGRRMRRNILRLAVEEAPVELADQQLMAYVWHTRVKDRARHEYGNPLLIMILIPLITELAKMLIEWWLERQSNRDNLAAWWSVAARDA